MEFFQAQFATAIRLWKEVQEYFMNKNELKDIQIFFFVFFNLSLAVF